MRKIWPFILLFGSGLAALTYQTVWLREFRFIFGASTAATAAVSALFMAGLGLGGWLLGPRADRTDRPLLLYGWLELAISILAGLSPWLLKLARALYFKTGGVLAMGLPGATAARLALAAVVVGLPAFLMGGTLPAAGAAVTAADDGARRRLGALYGVNTLGALAGVVLATFLVLEALGARDTLTLAVLLNVCLALAAIKLGRGSVPQVASEPAMPEPAMPEPKAPETGLPLRLALAAAAIAGFAFFLMELVWYRMLAPVLGGSVYTFGLILATALAGIGLGGALYPLVFRERRPRTWHLAATCLLEALVIMAPFALGDWLAAAAVQLRSLSAFGFGGLVSSWAVITGAVVFPAALVSGLQFPLLIALLGRGPGNLGRQTGLAYAYNTGGAIVGSLAGGFGLLPRLTAPGCWRLAGACLAGLGLVLALQAVRKPEGIGRPTWSPPLAAALALAIFLLIVPGPTAAWRHSPVGAGRVGQFQTLNQIRGWQADTRRNIAWEADGVESAVGLNLDNGYSFLINGKSDGSVMGDRGTQTMLGLIGAALHPEPRRALVVGLGTGATAGWLTAVPSMDQVDVVELEPAVLEVARLSALANRDLAAKLEDGGLGVRLIFNDAREVLNTIPDRYDLIVSEPSNPYRAGIASLFTREFYQEVAGRLAPGGLFLGWCQAYEIETASVFAIIATLKSVFPHVECWATQFPGDLIFLAAGEPLRPDPAALAGRLKTPPFREAMRLAWGLEGLEGFLAHHLADDVFLGRIAGLVNPANLNTDDLVPVEYAYAHSVGRSNAGFSGFDLLMRAKAQGRNQPPWAPRDAAFEALAANLFLASAYMGRVISWPAGHLSEPLARRFQTVRAWADGDFSAVFWNGAGRPESRLEILALAESLANKPEQDPELILGLLPELEDWWPACAALVKSFLAFNQNRPEESIGELEKALRILKKDPWEPEATVARGLRFVLALASGHPPYAGRLYSALEEPFALHFLESKRRTVLLDLAYMISPQKAVETLERFYEPHPMWNEFFLKKRLATYAAANHPRQARAAADLELFLDSTAPDMAAWLAGRVTKAPEAARNPDNPDNPE